MMTLKQNWPMVAAAFVVMLCLGSVYAWSLFVPSLVADHGLTHQQAQWLFGVLIAFYSVAMVTTKPLLKRLGIRLLIRLSSLCFVLGYGVAALSGGNFLWLLIGLGGIVGAGIALGYTSTITTCMQSFPKQKGFVTGLIVAGFGGGALVLSTIFGPLIQQGLPVLQAFAGVGILNGAGLLLASFFMRTPPEPKVPPCSEALDQTLLQEAPEAELSPSKPWYLQKAFWVLFLGMLTGTFAGFMVIGNLKPLVLWLLNQPAGQPDSLATLAISFLALGNASGRLSWGILVQRLGDKTLPFLPLLMGITIVLLPISLLLSPWLLMLNVALVGLMFGSNFVVYANVLATRFGVDEVPKLYPFILFAQAAAALSGPVIGGWLFDTTHSFEFALTLSAVVAFSGAGITLWLERSTNKQTATSIQTY